MLDLCRCRESSKKVRQVVAGGENLQDCTAVGEKGEASQLGAMRRNDNVVRVIEVDLIPKTGIGVKKVDACCRRPSQSLDDVGNIGELSSSVSIQNGDAWCTITRYR